MQHRPNSQSASTATRPNIAMAEVVDTAIALMDEQGKQIATEYLIAQGVSFRIIEVAVHIPSGIFGRGGTAKPFLAAAMTVAI